MLVSRNTVHPAGTTVRRRCPCWPGEAGWPRRTLDQLSRSRILSPDQRSSSPSSAYAREYTATTGYSHASTTRFELRRRNANASLRFNSLTLGTLLDVHAFTTTWCWIKSDRGLRIITRLGTRSLRSWFLDQIFIFQIPLKFIRACPMGLIKAPFVNQKIRTRGDI